MLPRYLDAARLSDSRRRTQRVLDAGDVDRAAHLGEDGLRLLEEPGALGVLRGHAARDLDLGAGALVGHPEALGLGDAVVPRAVGVLEASYCLDCADGMLARFKKLASKAGHLFDFFCDELKAVLLVGTLAVRSWRMGGLGLDGKMWDAGDVRFLLAGMAGVAIVASALSLTNFVRSPEVSGKDVTVEAFYETVEQKRSPAALLATFLRFLNHYPSHLWLWAIAGRLDAYLWLWLALNALYLARGWVSLVMRFGRP